MTPLIRTQLTALIAELGYGGVLSALRDLAEGTPALHSILTLTAMCAADIEAKEAACER